MANPDHVGKLLTSVKAWNRWRGNNQEVWPDLRKADLRNTRLSGASLVGAILTDTDLTGAILTRATLSKADLTEAILKDANLSDAFLDRVNLSDAFLNRANLSGASINRANLSRANLSDANLSGVNLRRANLSGVNLSGANLDKAHFGWTTLAAVDLGQTTGLDTCIHHGPSTIGIDTICQSNGRIPEGFLRGAGVPERFITYARSLIGQVIEFYSCFISYASQDQTFAERLNADLRSKNLRCWFASEDLKTGDRFQERIEESIRLYDKVIIVLSQASVRSRWVEREVNAAREREDRDNRMVLFPIRIDDAVMDAPQPWAADIRRIRHIGDFRGWVDREVYRKGLERLLRDLRAIPG